MAGSKKRVVLGVTGGIAAYKACELTRRLADHGFDVQVVMTGAAQQFVAPLSFQALSGRPVRTELFDASAEAAMGHIELARWAEVILVAPASADFMARLAHGLAPDLLSTICLATAAPVVLAPAMNRLMWANPATRSNTELLAGRGIRCIGPADGAQACGETGSGRMAEPEQIIEYLMAHWPGATSPLLQGCRILINAGPTYEDIDPARFIGNRSSGKMGFAIAAEAARLGAVTTLIAGPVQLETPAGVRRINVRSAAQMHAAVLAEVAAGCDVFIAAAAIADYRPADPKMRKIKRSGETLELALLPNPDIVAEVAGLSARPFVVGFAAETDDLLEHARGKLERKRLDLICANLIGVEGSGFEAECNEITLLWADGQQSLRHAPKPDIARQLLEVIAARINGGSAAA